MGVLGLRRCAEIDPRSVRIFDRPLAACLFVASHECHLWSSGVFLLYLDPGGAAAEPLGVCRSWSYFLLHRGFALYSPLARGEKLQAVAVLGSCLRGVCRSEEHTSELQSHSDLVCRLLLEKKKKKKTQKIHNKSIG